MISQKLVEAVKRSPVRQFRIAQSRRFTSFHFKQTVKRGRARKAGDVRVVAVGALVGLPASECFEKNGEQ